MHVAFYFFFIAVFSVVGIVSILFSEKKHKPSQDNPDTPEVIENRFGNYCDDCGATIKDKAKYCVNCGKKI
jgi:hypothetical protein